MKEDVFGFEELYCNTAGLKNAALKQETWPQVPKKGGSCCLVCVWTRPVSEFTSGGSEGGAGAWM